MKLEEIISNYKQKIKSSRPTKMSERIEVLRMKNRIVVLKMVMEGKGIETLEQLLALKRRELFISGIGVSRYGVIREIVEDQGIEPPWDE